ncbi:MAG: diguanylate cyclase [Deltaproteobacteria bacterium]|nr:diguanylate cyclase [Deltaproteobacteria bacterium]
MKRNRLRGTRFARRIYTPRIVGLGLGFLCVATVFYQKAMPVPFWAGLVANGFLWPHIAYIWAKHSRNPYKAEIRNLMIDSFLGGLWVPLMSFNVLPSVLILIMMSMDNISVGGIRLFIKGMFAHITAGVLAVLIFGFDLKPESTMLNVLSCLPMLTVFPLHIGMISHRLSLELSRQKRQLESLSQTDGMSDLYNRRYWEELVGIEFHRCKRSKGSSSLILIDIDHFKDINDRYGHATGDEVIRDIAKLLRAGLRQTDIVGRFGGDEFGIVLPDTDAGGACTVAEKLRKKIQASILQNKRDGQCTASFGIAEVEGNIKKHGDWIERADRALYRAKQEGRNRSILFGDKGGSRLPSDIVDE